jgi:hypothetical protein
MESTENKSKIKHWRETIREKTKAFFLLRAGILSTETKKIIASIVYNNMTIIFIVFGAKEFLLIVYYLAKIYSQANRVITPKLIHRQIHYLAEINSQRVLASVNTYMTTDNEKLLIDLLGQFFTEYDINKRNMLNNNRIAKLLKAQLLEKGRWKNLSRGKAIVKEELKKDSKNECPF